MKKLMVQNPQEADRVVRTKTRINELARHIEEHDERAKKIAKHDNHKASSGKNQASSSSSSGVVRSQEEQQLLAQVISCKRRVARARDEFQFTSFLLRFG